MLRRLLFFFGASRRALTGEGQSTTVSHAQGEATVIPPPFYGVSTTRSAASASPPWMNLRASGVCLSTSAASGDGQIALVGEGASLTHSELTSGPPILLPGGQIISHSYASGDGVLSLKGEGVCHARSAASGEADVDYEGEVEAAGELQSASEAHALTPVLAGVFLVTVLGPPEIVIGVVDGSAGNGAFDLDLADRLPAGRWVLGVRKVDQYGTMGDMATLEVVVGDEAEAAGELVRAQGLTAEAWAGGMIGLRWLASLTSTPAEGVRGLQLPAAEWEIAAAEAPGTILATIDGGRLRVLSVLVGPFVNASTVYLLVRASDGEVDGVRGPWMAAPPVVADSEAPAVPEGWDCGG